MKVLIYWRSQIINSGAAPPEAGKYAVTFQEYY